MLDTGRWSSHQQRLVTGLLLGGVLLAVLIRGPFWSVCLVVGLASLVGLWEFQGLVCDGAPERHWQLVFLAGGALLPIGAALGGELALHSSLIAVLFGGFLAFLFWSPDDPKATPTLAWFSLGWLYVSYLLSHALLLAGLEKGRLWLFWPLLIIFAGDMGAFYGGRRWGKHKLYEKVSPKKTREGALSGLAASVAVGMLFVILFLPEVPRHWAGVFCLLLAVVGQVGDLLESMLKRLGGKKDSSNLLPGHGGLLDRLDSLLFAFPTTWYFHEWLKL
jgi:phosphatidate cytidylyltransferase